MIDRREAILARLVTLLTELTVTDPPAVVSVVRNKELRKDEARPAIVILDGDESPAFNAKTPGRMTLMSAYLMTMRPQIFILMNEQRPTRETIGTATNTIRSAILGLLSTDITLRSLYGPNGSIALGDVTTDMKSGGEIRGSMLLNFAITYPLVPS